MIDFTIGTLPVRVRVSFFVTALLFGLVGPRDLAVLAIWVSVVLVSVLLHELGHAYVARAYGARAEIELYAMGGLTRWDRQEPSTPGMRAVIAASGSAVGIVIGGAIWLARDGGYLTTTIGTLPSVALDLIVFVNLGWGLINWLPIRALDGGHILESLLEIWSPDHYRRIAGVIFVVFAVVAIGFALSYQYPRYVYLAILIALFGLRGIRDLFTKRSDVALARELEAARQAAAQGDYAVAGASARRLATEFSEPAHRRAAAELAVDMSLAANDISQALELVGPRQDGFMAPARSQGRVYLAAGRALPAIEALTVAVKTENDRAAVGDLVAAYQLAGTFTEARQLFESLPPEIIDQRHLFELAQAARRSGALEDAAALERMAGPSAHPPMA